MFGEWAESVDAKLRNPNVCDHNHCVTNTELVQGSGMEKERQCGGIPSIIMS